MFDLDKFHEIWQTITRNKVRSLLTAFGVFWGMFMFIGMLGIGQGFENGMKSKFSNIATNSMFVYPELLPLNTRDLTQDVGGR